MKKSIILFFCFFVGVLGLLTVFEVITNKYVIASMNFGAAICVLIVHLSAKKRN